MDPSLPAAPAALKAISVAQFMQHLADSKLFPAAELEALAAGLDLAKYADGKQLALDLVKQQQLTLYQATMIHQGKRGLILGRYVIQEKLGAGGMGMVYKARQQGMGRIVALKVLPPAISKTPGAVQRFQREVQAAAQLNHPNIVRAYDADQASGVHFLVMEYVDGNDLSRLVKGQGPLSVTQAVTCVRQAALGLAHAHASGIVHRDIKPGNLLLNSAGVVKILDMGLARFDAAATNVAGSEAIAPDEITKSGSILGTTDYMAPEQAINTKKADHRADVYSLGCTLYYLLTARPLYDGETAMEKLLAHRETPIPSLLDARPEVSEAIAAVFQRMVAKKPDQRQQSMEQVAAELEDALADDGKRTTSLKAVAAGPAAPACSQDETMVASATATTLRPLTLRRKSLVVAIGSGVLALALLLAVVLGLRVASSKPVAQTRPGDTRPMETVAAPIFNGTDLSGWQVLHGNINSWRVHDGAVTVAGPGAGWLVTARDYKDFELRLEYRMSRPGNSGVCIRAPLAGDPYISGLEIDINDTAPATAIGATGSLSGVVAPTRAAARPAGAWNQLTVTARGRHLAVELNGVKTVDVNLDGFAALAASRPGLLRREGRIGLQGQNGVGEFRNLTVHVLPPPPVIALAPLDDAWVQRVTGLSGPEQVAAVSKRMVELNPGFNGQLGPQFDGAKVVGVQLTADQVADIRPLRVFRELRTFRCNGSGPGKGKLTDLGALSGMRLTHAEFVYTLVADLTPLRDMPLTHLECGGTPAADLTPLRGLPLTVLNCSMSPVSDLAPLADLPLDRLLVNDTLVTDLSPLRRARLRFLHVSRSGVGNLAPLAGQPLEELHCQGVKVSDFTPLRNCPLRLLFCDGNPARALAVLETMPSLHSVNGRSRQLWYAYRDSRPVPRWQVLLPFARTAREPFDPAARGGALPAEEFARTYVGLNDKSVVWQERQADEHGQVLIPTPTDHAVLFAHATIHSASERTVDLLGGCDDTYTIWLNGEKIHQTTTGRGLNVTSDQVRARLKKGPNHFLIRCENGTQAWGFSLRVPIE